MTRSTVRHTSGDSSPMPQIVDQRASLGRGHSRGGVRNSQRCGMATARTRRWRLNLAASTSSKVRGSAKATIDHDEIREWVESHGGHPALVKRTARGGKGGILRIDFPGFSGEGSLEECSWDDFFEKFEESQLAFLYQDATGAGRPSRFNKLVARDTVELAPRRRSSKRSSSGTRAKARRKTTSSRSKSEARSAKRSPSRASGASIGKRPAKKAARAGTLRGTARSAVKSGRAAKGSRDAAASSGRRARINED